MKTKLIVFSLFVLIVGSMIFPGVRADVITSQSLLIELKEKVHDAPDYLFRGYQITNTKQLKDALKRKIDVVIKLLDKGEFGKAHNKLGNDIATKLTICDTTRTKALSWLSYIHTPQQDVYDFSDECQDLINRVIILLDQ